MKIYIGADHAGFRLKEQIMDSFKKAKISCKDFGVSSKNAADYPDIAFVVAEAVAKDKNARGILICGTGTGMVIAANKVSGIRAAVVYDDYTAIMAREHNDANIACLRGRRFSAKKALRVLKIWLQTKFSKETRHELRLEKIKML